jgi:hypothetical protein
VAHSRCHPSPHSCSVSLPAILAVRRQNFRREGLLGVSAVTETCSGRVHRGCAGWERRIKGVVSEECQCCLSGRFCFVRDWLDNKNRDRSKKAAPEKNAELPPPIRDRIPPRDPPINYSLRWNAPSCDGGEQKNTSRPLLPRRIAALGGRRGPSASFPTAEIISWHGPGLLAV